MLPTLPLGRTISADIVHSRMLGHASIREVSCRGGGGGGSEH